MRALALIAALLLAGCETTAEMASRAPDRLVHSAKARAVVSECLLNRLSSPEVKPEVAVGDNSTALRFVSLSGIARKPVLYMFTVTDAGGGSVIEARTMHSLGKLDMSTAETCF